tara:strand:- start:1549 stop:1692 length:144 start_codon:yes stop_codon:yes gene_type:complete
VNYQPLRVCCYDGPRTVNKEQVATDAAKAEANGERLILVFFVSTGQA